MNEHRGVLFDVFAHTMSGASFGIGDAADGSKVVIDKPARAVAVATKTTLVHAVRLMGEKLKAGYKREASSMYFAEADQKFTYVHPDLYWGEKKWTIAAKATEIAKGIEAVAAAMSQIDRTLISDVEIKAWSKRQANNSAYLVAFADLPVWTLVLAQTAMQSGWPVRANPSMKGAPASLPSTNPSEWGVWLQQTFSVKAISGALTLLDYTFNSHFVIDQQVLIDEGNWSSLI